MANALDPSLRPLESLRPCERGIEALVVQVEVELELDVPGSRSTILLALERGTTGGRGVGMVDVDDRTGLAAARVECAMLGEALNRLNVDADRVGSVEQSMPTRTPLDDLLRDAGADRASASGVVAKREEIEQTQAEKMQNPCRRGTLESRSIAARWPSRRHANGGAGDRLRVKRRGNTVTICCDSPDGHDHAKVTSLGTVRWGLSLPPSREWGTLM